MISNSKATLCNHPTTKYLDFDPITVPGRTERVFQLFQSVSLPPAMSIRVISVTMFSINLARALSIPVFLSVPVFHTLIEQTIHKVSKKVLSWG